VQKLLVVDDIRTRGSPNAVLLSLAIVIYPMNIYHLVHLPLSGAASGGAATA